MTAQASTSYQNYQGVMRWLGGAVLVVLALAALATIVSGYWVIATAIQERSDDLGQGAFFVLLGIVTLIGGVFVIGVPMEVDDEEVGKVFVIGSWILTTILWLLVGLYFLFGGVRHTVGDDELRLQRSGEVVYAGELATRGFYRKWSAPIKAQKDFRVSGVSEGQDSTRNVRFDLQTDMTVTVRLKQGPALEEFLRNVALSPNGFSVKDVDDRVWSVIETDLKSTLAAIQQDPLKYSVGTAVTPPFAWIESVEVTGAETRIANHDVSGGSQRKP